MWRGRVAVLASLVLLGGTLRCEAAGGGAPCRLMPLPPSLVEQLREGRFDSVTVVNLQRLSQRMKALGVDQPRPIRAPVLGSRPALVLLVDFPDLLHDAVSTPPSYQSLLFSVGTYPAPGSMRDYYRKVSHNLFDISPGQVDTAWRTAPHDHTYYANADGKSGTDDDYGMGTYPNNAQGLVVDAVTAADPYLDFSSFATNGEVQGLFVIHAGRGAETDPTHVDWIWSHSWALNEHALTVDGVTVNDYSMEPEYTWDAGDSTIGVFAHEYGHVLGLPDLYDTNYASQGLGDWSLMSGGSWNGIRASGDSPAFLDAWSRIQLGWLTPQVPTTPVTGATLAAAEDTPAALQLYPGEIAANEYFLLENRQRTSFDAALPGSGLLIYHVDDGSTQENVWHPLVMLEQADGLSSLQRSWGTSDAGDPFPGSSRNTTFASNTNPNSRCYGGGDSFLSVTNISPSSSTMSCDLGMQSFHLLVDFPLDSDPGWTTQGQWAYGQPTGGGLFPYLDPTAGYTGANVYGYNLSGNYPNNMTGTDYLTTPPLDCSAFGSVALTFWRWLGVEEGSYDHANIQVSSDGTNWTEIYENPEDITVYDGQWVRWFYDISPLAAGKSAVRIRWGLGPSDEGFTLCGWNLDDVQLWGLLASELAPVADFTDTPIGGTAPLSVSFTDTSTGTITAWAWAFGDGGAAAQQNPLHTYTTAGTYTVSLTASNAYGSNTQSKPNSVTVSAVSQAPTADFAATQTYGAGPLAVQFADLSTPAPTAWSWTFGDGGLATLQNPTHVYTPTGSYTVSLTASNSIGSDTESKPNYITVSDLPKVLSADFSAAPTSGDPPLYVQFTDLTTGGATAWQWNFGDGASSTLQHPAHLYTTAGSYPVSLTASSSRGSDTRTKLSFLAVGSVTPVVASFTAATHTGPVPLTVAFTDTSRGSPTAWSWAFGDGMTATTQNPSHTYTTAGAYSVSLTVSRGAASSTWVAPDSIIVTPTGPALTADFTAAPSSGSAPLNVTFIDASTGSPTAWTWSFGDGGASAAENPIHPYTAAGAYTVALTVSNAYGSNTRTKINFITVGPGGTGHADFLGTPTTGVAPLLVNFADLSTNSPTAWVWSFGDGSTSTEQNPAHLYVDVGRHTVSLSATGAGGASTATKARYILVSFPDVPLTYWSLQQILACVDAGLVTGYPDGRYQPLTPVTRDQMAVYIARALAGGNAKVPTGPAQPSFTDDPSTYWAYKYIEYAKAHGIVQGYPDGSYAPTQPVDRGQMAVYVARAAAGSDSRVPAGPPTASFPDVPTTFWAFRYVEYCKSRSIVAGYPDGAYHPELVVTRDQMAVYVARAFGLQ